MKYWTTPYCPLSVLSFKIESECNFMAAELFVRRQTTCRSAQRILDILLHVHEHGSHLIENISDLA